MTDWRCRPPTSRRALRAATSCTRRHERQCGDQSQGSAGPWKRPRPRCRRKSAVWTVVCAAAKGTFIRSACRLFPFRYRGAPVGQANAHGRLSLKVTPISGA
jgi:hypothetical protein